MVNLGMALGPCPIFEHSQARTGVEQKGPTVLTHVSIYWNMSSQQCDMDGSKRLGFISSYGSYGLFKWRVVGFLTDLFS